MTHTSKINETWEMYTTTSGWITCYDIFTLAWKHRGWKRYFADKVYIILSGKCELTQEIGGKDEVTELSGSDWVFKILSGTPHIFYFPEDTRMLEWFPEGTRSENFERYRKMK